jgi:hypothetical protein
MRHPAMPLAHNDVRDGTRLRIGARRHKRHSEIPKVSSTV